MVWRDRIGRILIGLSMFLLFLSYYQYIPHMLTTPALGNYVKNHMIREQLFGATLALFVLRLCWIGPRTRDHYIQTVALGGLVAGAFWIGFLTGHRIDGIAQVWGPGMGATGTFSLHVPQLVFYLVGAAILPADRTRFARA